MKHDGERWAEEVRWLRGLAMRLVADPDLADDLAQETALIALRRSPAFDPDERPWRVGVLRRLVFNRRRARARRIAREALAHTPDDTPPPEELVEQVEVARALTDAVLALDEPFRRTLILRYFHDHSPREIARRLGEPEPTVRSRLSRAIAKLREHLDREHGDDRRAWVLPFVAWISASVCGGGAAAAGEAGTTGANGAGTGATTIGSTVGGGIIVSAKKLGVAAAVLVFLVIGVSRWSGSPRSDDPEGHAGGSGAAITASIVGDVPEAGAENVPAATTAIAPQVASSHRGRILDRPTGAPLAGATVVLSAGDLRVESTTDATGTYELTLLEPPRSPRGELIVTAPAYCPVLLPLSESARPWAPVLPTIHLDPGVEVVGVVVDRAGDPIAGADLAIWDRLVTRSRNSKPGAEWWERKGTRLPLPMTSGPDGRFAMVVHAGAVAVEARTEDTIGARDVTIVAGSRDELVVVVEPGARLDGTVRDAEGEPVVGAEVVARPRRSGGAGILPPLNPPRTITTETDAAGAFTIVGDPTALQLSVEHPEFLPWSDTAAASGVDLRTDASPTIVLTRAKNVRGRARASAPLPAGTTVALEIGRGVWNEFLGDDGAFAFGPLDPALDRGVLRVPGFLPVTLAWAPEPGDEDLGLVELDDGLTCAIRVADLHGVPIDGATVRAHPPGSARYSRSPWAVGRTDAEGRVSLAGLAAGPVQLEVVAPGYTMQLVDLAIARTMEQTAVVLVRPALLTGRVVDAHGAPLPFAEVRLVNDGTDWIQERLEKRISAEQPRDLLDTRTDGEGRFRFPHVPAGSPLIVGVRPVGGVMERFPIDAPAAEESVELGDLVVGGPGALEVRVHDESGAPLAGAFVQIRPRAEAESRDVSLDMRGVSGRTAAMSGSDGRAVFRT